MPSYCPRLELLSSPPYNTFLSTNMPSSSKLSRSVCLLDYVKHVATTVVCGLLIIVVAVVGDTSPTQH